MKGLAFLTLALPLGLWAQGTEKTATTDTGTVTLHFFVGGGISTKAWTDTTGRWGRCRAYNKHGAVIYEQQTRNVGGHATVWFRYHPNGGISRAEYSTMPDGGIQWYRSITTFDTAGNQTGFWEEGRDNQGPMGPRLAPAPAPKQAVRVQHLYTNEYFVVARKNCRVQLRPQQTGPDAKNLDATLLKGDTLRGGIYSLGERFGPPLAHVAITATDRRGRPKYKVLRVDSVQVNAAHRRWYLVVGR